MGRSGKKGEGKRMLWEGMQGEAARILGHLRGGVET